MALLFFFFLLHKKLKRKYFLIAGMCSAMLAAFWRCFLILWRPENLQLETQRLNYLIRMLLFLIPTSCSEESKHMKRLYLYFKNTLLPSVTHTTYCQGRNKMVAKRCKSHKNNSVFFFQYATHNSISMTMPLVFCFCLMSIFRSACAAAAWKLG